MDELIEELPDWLVNPKPTLSEEIEPEQIARMDTAIHKINAYFQKKYWPPKMVETPLKGDRVMHGASHPPVEFFWTPSRHRGHESLGYACVWGYDVRHLHYYADRPSPAYSVYHGPISMFIRDFSENPEKLDDWEKYILEEITLPEYVHERNYE